MFKADLFRPTANNISKFLMSFVLLLSLTQQNFAQNGSSLACNNHVQVSLNLDCEAEITPEMILEGEDENGDYSVVITGVTGTTVFTIGTYEVTVFDNATGNSCWGTIDVEDKLAPQVLDCLCEGPIPSPDCTFFCTDLPGALNGTFTLPTPVVDENCGFFTSDFSDVVTDGTCGQKILERNWLFTDNSGNSTSSCTQTFIFDAVDLTDITPPVEQVILDCGADASMPGIVNFFTPTLGLAVANTYAYPTVNGQPVNGVICNLAGTKEDLVIPTCMESCSNSFKVLRNWQIIDWCTGASISFQQTIKAVDQTPPTVEANDITVSTDPWTCSANFFMPAPTILVDDCTNFVDYTVTGPAGVIITFNAGQNRYLVQGAPKGVHTFTYVASDCCDNTTNREITVTVQDNTPPVAIAKEFVTVSLTNSVNGGSAKVFAGSIDNGSHDGCTNVKLEIRRDTDACNVNGNLTYNNDGHPQDSPSDPDNGEFVKFCCSDVTNSLVDVDGDGELDEGYLKVWLRVWDDGDMNGIYGSSGDNYNETWSFVKVEDKLNPILVCPADITIECDDDETDLALTGEPFSSSICGSTNPTYSDFDNTNQCNVGLIIRTFSIPTAPQVTCQQRITKRNNELFDGNDITWPTDRTTTCLDLSNNGDVPTWTADACDMIGYSLESDTFTIEDGACLKIINEWSVIDWCQYDQNFPGSSGIWSRLQIIKVIDEVAPIIDCANEMFPVDDYTDADNDGNTCETINLTLTNTADDQGDCGSEWLKWTVTIDLYGDGTFDYEYSSFLSAGDSNFNDSNGNGIPDIYVGPTSSNEEVSVTIPEDIPSSMANHKIVWKVSDGCGNVSSCQNTFMVVDKKAPTPYCINVSSAVMDNGMLELWACDFDLGSFDNCTEAEDLRFTFEDINQAQDPNYNEDTKCSSKVFDCDDVLNSPVDVTMYVWDEKDNRDFCTIELTLIDNQNACEVGSRVAISGSVYTPQNEMLEDAAVKLENDVLDFTRNESTSDDGGYVFANNPMEQNYVLSADVNDSPLNGISTLDLVMIQRHILGLAPFADVYQVIASDVNDDEKISATDLIVLRKMILGVVTEFPSELSHYTVAADHDYADFLSPWPIQTNIQLENVQSDMIEQNFVSVKIGDVNGSADYGLRGTTKATTRNLRSATLEVETSKENEVVTYSFYAKDVESLTGLQVAFDLAGVENVAVSGSLLDINKDQYYLNDKGELMISWSNAVGVYPNASTPLFSISANASSASISLQQQKENEAYDTDLNTYEVKVVTRSSGNQAFDALHVYQNEPNPWKDETRLVFATDSDGKAMIQVFDITGKMVQAIDHNATVGENVVTLERNDFPSSGMYYVKITKGNQSATKKMLLIE